MASTLFSPTSRVFTPRPLSSSPPPFPMAATFFLSTHSSQTLTIRSGITLIIDKEGIIQHPTITNLAIGRSLPKTLRPLQSLQYVQENPDKVCPSSDPNFPSKSTHLRLKHPLSHSLSAKTTTRTTTRTTTSTTTSLPLTPPKVPILPSNPHPQHPISIKAPPNPNPNPKPNPDPDFHTKALFLDSIGVDSLSLLSHHNSGTAIAAAITTASLSDLKTVFEYLTSFEFSNEDLNRMISMCPQILTLRLRDISAVFAFLLREANVGAADLRRVVHRRPRLLVSPVESRLRPTMYFLQSIGIHEVHRHTHLLSCSVEDKYIPKIEYFQKVGFQYRETISMFRRFPALFCYSVKGNFEPKFNYFVMEMGRELKELKEFPQYFSFSLEKRIKPRHQSCVENGVCFPLPVMLKMKEEDFRQRLDACHDSSIPRSSSPLWCANHCDVDTM